MHPAGCFGVPCDPVVFYKRHQLPKAGLTGCYLSNKKKPACVRGTVENHVSDTSVPLGCFPHLGQHGRDLPLPVPDAERHQHERDSTHPPRMLVSY
jgi:hypothetical protein